VGGSWTSGWLRGGGGVRGVGVPVDKGFGFRVGGQVVGIENQGFGKVRLPAGDTGSPEVKKEVIQ
ncbi:conjugal transfer protein, partial [Salmonella enterica subsp. enterica serovar Panama]